MSQEYPKQGTPRTINVDKWLNDNQSGKHVPVPPRIVRPVNNPDVAKHRAKLRDTWGDYQTVMAREAKLEPKPQECSECGKTERCYINDYMCFVCRDALEGTE